MRYGPVDTGLGYESDLVFGRQRSVASGTGHAENRHAASVSLSAGVVIHSINGSLVSNIGEL